MSVSNKRPVAGSRSPARPNTSADAARRMRMGLLGSTALIAASLAVSPAFAQVVVNPAGGGTITRTGGGAPTVNDQSAGGGGIQISNVSQATTTTVNGVTINNTTGAPTSDALRILGSTSGLNSTGVTITGVNTLTTTVNGGSALYIQTNANMGVSITSSGSVFTGSYGINLQSPGGYISFDASNQSQSFVANGTHIAGFNAISNVNAQIMLGSSTFTGFDTGINASNFYGSTVEMTGGSINALVTGIRTDATGGGSTITSQAAIVAPTGIHSTNTNGTTITTSGAGTINSTVAGTGTGILATSSGGTNAIAINVGAAIGNTTAPAIGVSATTTGSSTGAINITTTAAITAISRGVEIVGATTGTTGTITIGADISAATAVYANIGSYNVTVASGVNISSTANGSAGLYLVNGTMTATNNGTITSTGTGTGAAGVRFSNPNNTLINSATGSITGLNGAYLQNGPTTVVNAGTITGTGGLNTAGVRLGGGGSVNNSNVISGYDAIWSSFGGTLTNSGTLTGFSNGVSITGGAVALTNTGTISTSGGVGFAGVLINSAYTFGTGTIANSGTITGGADATHGYGAEILDGLFTLTNQSGGTISGGQGAILLSSNDLATLNLELGSTVTGDIVSEDTGARTLTVNGVLTGDFSGAAGSGVVTFALGATGSMQSATLGTGNDIFTYQGGTFAGTISGGTGTDSLLVDLGSTAVSRSVDLADLSDFDTYRLVTGTLTLTGSRDGGAGWLIDGGTPTSMRLSGSLTNVTGSAFTLTTADQLTLNLGSQASATGHVIYSAVNGNNIQNAGTITSGSGAVSGINIGSGTVGNTGTITYSGGLITDAGYGVNTTTSNLTLTNSAAASITGRWDGVRADAGAIVTNTGRIQGDRFAGVETTGASTVTNNSGGVIYGATAEGAGVLINSANVTVTNASGGTLAGGGAGAVQNRGAGTVTINNSGLLGAGSVDGAGAFTLAGSGSAAVGAAGTLNVNNLAGGSLTGALAGVRTTGGTTNTSNAGTISAATAGGYGVVLDGGSMSLTNLSGGDISGALGSFLLGGTGSATIDLQTGSTATGSIVATGSGTRTLVLGGAFAGNLDATGNSGAVNLTLNTSATGYTLLHAGSGADSLTFNGSGSRSFSVDNLSGWETGAFTGGAWTLTGTGNANSFTSGVTVNGAALTISNTQQFQGAIGLTLTGGGSITTTASLSNTRTLAMTGAGSLGAASGQTLTQSGVVSGAGVLTLNGPGTVVLSGANTYTGGTVVNAGILRLGHTSAAGTGLIRMIDPQIDFAATGTYNNNISLEVVDGQQAADPTILNNTSGGAITLAGRIYETTGVGGANQYVTFNGGSITLTNGANSWAGVTRINSGATLLGTTASISGASIVNNGTLTYQNVSAGTANQNISGSGAININGTGVTLAGAITTTGQLTVSGPGSSLILGGSRSGASNTGVVLSATGGSLTVANGASLQSGQYNGVRVTGANASVTNLGLIQNAGTGGDGTVGAGIYVLNGGAGGTTTVNNGSIADTGAGSTIQGRNAGVRHESGSTDLLVVNNYGLIVGDLYNGVENTAGGLTVNNFAGGYITATLGNGVSSASASAVSVTNAGVIGRNIAGTVTVNGYGVTTNGLLTLVNQSGGLITGTLGGIQSNGAGSSITNQAGGTILGNYGVVTAGGTLTNSGLIRGFNDAIILGGATALTNNAGGLIVGAGNEGVFVSANGSTINNAGLIVNTLTGIGANFSVAITNSGVIASGAAPDAATTSAHISRNTGTAIALGAGGSVTNLAGGEILGGAGVSFNNGASGTLTNAGLIDGSVSYGVQMSGAGTITNQSGGTITGAIGSIQLTGAGARIVDLQAGSTANGQIVSTATGTQTVNIAGTLNGAYNAATGAGVDNLTLAGTGSMTSADLGAGADSFTYQGGGFSGLIDAGTGTDSFISALGAGSASLNLDNLANFETFAHQSGALTLTGTGTFSGGASVYGGSLIVDGVVQSAVNVALGGTLSGDGTITGGVTIADGGSLTGAEGSTLTMGFLGLSSGSAINATFSGVGGPALFAVTGNLILDGTVNVASTGAYGFGVYGLMTYGGVLTDNGLVIGTTPAGAQRVQVQTSVAGQVNIVHAPTELLFWDGGNAGQHDNGAVNGGAGTWTAAGSEWTDAGGLFNGAMEPQPGFAIFQGVGGTVTVDDVNGAVGVTGMQFAANGYNVEGDSITLANASTTIRVGDGTAPSAAWTATIASALTGAGGLVKTDLGTLILAGDSDYTGGTTVNAGTLQIGDGATAGSIAGSVALANNSAVVFARSDNHDFANAVSGAGMVGVNGVVTLSGAITASLGVNVGAGSTATLSNVDLVNGTAVTAGLDSTVNVTAGGTVRSQNGTGIFVSAANGAVNNAGTVTGGGTAIFSSGGLTLTNAASGAINGGFAISALQNLDLTNAGAISASVTNFNSSGIYAGGTGTISNTGAITSGTNAIYTQGAGSLTNSGLIQGGGAGSTVRLFGANSSVTNLAGGEITTTGTGVGLFLDGLGATVVNSGTIRGGNAMNLVSGGGTITNDGMLIGTAGSAVIGNGGTVIANLAGGSITGATNGVNIVTGSGTLTNDGAITGTTGQGVLLQAGGAITNTGSITGGQSGVRSLAALNLTSSGTISGSVNAVESVGAFNDTLTFLAGSITTGAVLTGGGDDVVSLAGTLNGALDTGAGADAVTLFDTAGLTSTLDGGDGFDALVLDGSGAGSLAIDSVLNFESRDKNGAGVWTLTGVDSSTMGWSINSGTLAISGGQAINDAAAITIAGPATLQLNNSEQIGSLNGAGAVALGANVLIVGGGGGASTYAGVISGTGSLQITGGSTLTLSGANTYSGTTYVTGGTLRLGASNVLSNASELNVAASGVMDLQGFSDTVALAILSGVLNGTGTLTATEYGLYGATVNANLGAGALYNASGTSTLSGASAADLVTVLGGTLTLGASDRIIDSAGLQVMSGATFDLGAFDETVDVTAINGTLAGTGTLTADQHQLDGATVNANLAGGSVYVIAGASTLNGLSNADLLSVLGGSLTLGASDRIADTAVLGVSSGAVLNIGAFNESVAIAALSGTVNGTGTLTAGEYSLSGATVNASLGAGDLYNTGGVSTLNGTSGADLVSVLDGTLALGASDRLADNATVSVASGSTLNLNAFNDTVDLALLEGTLAGTGALTAADYLLNGATVNANLGAGALYSLGASTLNGLSGAGLVSVQDGVLTLGASDRLSDAAALVVVDGILNLGAFNETVATAVLHNGTLNGTGTLTAADYLLDDATVNANLGAGVLYSIGASTLNGTAAADQALVDGGVLNLGGANRLADNAVVTVSSGAALNLGAFDETVGLLTLNGALNGTGTLSAAQYQLNAATVNANLGAGLLIQQSGVSTLHGTSGATQVALLDGTLTLGASNRLADNATVSVGAGSTLNLDASDDTVGLVGLNGALAGTGTLTAGEYDLNGAMVNANLGVGNLFNTGGVSTLTGRSGAANVVVQAGTLTLGASNRLADTATVSVGSGSTLNLGAFNDTVGLAVLNGALNGTGTLTAAQYQLNAATVNANLGAGTLFNLGGASILNGTAGASQVSINAGTLRLGASERLSDAATVSVASGATFNVNGFDERIGALFGTGDINVGAGRLTFGGAESGFGGRLSGAGSLVHTGGLFTLMGDHTIASIGNTGGELRFLGTTTGGLSASGGSVTGAGTIGGALTASNGAVLSPGLAGIQNGIGGFTAGGLTLNGGTLAIDVLGTSGGNLIDQLRINGTATLTGGLLAPTFQGSSADFNFSTRYLFLQANNLVGTFANGANFTAAAQEGLFWRVRYDLTPNGAVLELRELTNFDPGMTGNGTGNQRAVGQSLSGGQLAASDDWAGILSIMAGLNDTDRKAVFDSISGEPLADMTTSLFSANDSFLTAVRDGGLGGRDDGGEALNFVDRMSFAGGRDNVADRLGDVLGAFDPSASTARGEGGWVSAYTGDQTLDGKPGMATIDSRLNGFAGGYGVRNGAVSIGAAGGVSRVEADVVARQAHYESDLAHGAGYVAFDDGVWAADVTGTFYRGDLDSRRGVHVGVFQGQAVGNTHVEGQAFSASVARRFQVSDNTMIALGAVGTASNASVDGFTETGAGGLSLQASGLERDWQSLQVGARGTQDYRVNGRGFRIYAGAGVLATTGDRQAIGDMRFTGAPTGFGSFTVEGAETPPLAGVADFGLEVGVGEGLTLSAGYRGLFSDRLQDNQVGVKLKASW
ncbi:autotransporter-associated beta strand repeat-containing protein [Brevundimonas sp.]|uniref:autotransporter-associated beta strand repeat-containing protein n=1 Tax=Brevundimonas sp. TaxID=1871086 RepID=UPI002BCC2379|nr:autotransporter-associated beta strand repeat-containing protein [Brevundimonas sp.]HWQ86719.1 autotransporter-associated beta strand repeat-containing protein [Brevundimonas sp.]